MVVLTLGQASVSALGGMTMQAPRRPGLPPVPRTHARRDSLEAGTFEATFFAVPVKGETDRLLRVARRSLDAGRQLRREARAGDRVLSVAERRMATLTASAVRVYEEIVTLARLNHGRVFPSYDHLARATALGRATIARALHILEDIGFLVRRRRFRRVNGDGAGPRIKQTSNVYRPTLPRSVLSYLPRWMRPAPVPDDAAQRDTEHLTDTTAMLDTLSCQELAHVLLDGDLGDALARFGAAIDRHERESQTKAQSISHCHER